MKKYILSVFVLICSLALGQTDLEGLNQEAFIALENDDSTVVIKANKLISEGEESAGKYAINGHTILGIYNKNNGYYETAISEYLKALKIAKQQKDAGRTSAILNNIGGIYELQDNLPRAKFYYLSSLKIEDSLQQDLQRSIRLYNLGNIYFLQDQLSEALNYFNQSLLIEQNSTNPEGFQYAQIAIAETYVKMSRLKDAQYILRELDTINFKSNSELARKKLFLDIHYNIAREFYDKSLYLLDSLEQNLKANSADFELADVYELKIAIYKATQNFEQCVVYFERLLAAKDAIHGTQVRNSINDLVMKNETENIQYERDLAKNMAKKEAKIKKYSLKISYFLVTATLLTLLTLLFYRKKT